MITLFKKYMGASLKMKNMAVYNKDTNRCREKERRIFYVLHKEKLAFSLIHSMIYAESGAYPGIYPSSPSMYISAIGIPFFIWSIRAQPINFINMEISIQGLTKKYGGNKFGLKNFSLELKYGILGLIGPNSTGKSTLMRILATISKPIEGHVFLDGADIVRSPNNIRKVLRYLPQDFGVYQNLTAVEFLEYLGAIKGFSGKSMKKRIDALVEDLNLTAVRNNQIATYSGGMRQRIGIAQVLLGDTKLIILDEPTAGLG